MNRSKFLIAGSLACLATLTLIGCGKERSRADDDPRPTIVATTTMIADMVQQIAGEELRVITLMGPGVDPHTYRAGSSDATALRKADGIIYNGLLLEGTMSGRLDDLAKTNDSVLSLGGTLTKDETFQPIGMQGHPDPHLWGDAELWAKFPPIVGEHLAKIDPENAELYRERAAVVAQKYHELHAWGLAQVQTIPAANRTLITSHDAFAYFGRAYEIEVIGVQGISTDSEPGTGAIVGTIDLIKERKVPAIFVESSTNQKTIERISKDSGARIGGVLFSDATGALGDLVTIDGREVDKGTYEGMFMYNVHLIVKALGTASE